MLARATSVKRRSPIAAEAPVILTTESLDKDAQGEWVEDLRVMDKLIRKALGDSARPYMLDMLGVQVGPSARPSPMYVQGAGVVLSAAVNWPLAAAPAEEGKGAQPRKADSPWERAKQEISGDTGGDVPGEAVVVDGGVGFRYVAKRDGESQPVFDQKKLDHLLDDILTVLPQASNFRHLKASESVIITVVGTDDAARPVRLTVKAKKSDIDDAAAKKVDAATFKQRVTQRIG
jgi:hypothetical protein